MAAKKKKPPQIRVVIGEPQFMPAERYAVDIGDAQIHEPPNVQIGEAVITSVGPKRKKARK